MDYIEASKYKLLAHLVVKKDIRLEPVLKAVDDWKEFRSYLDAYKDGYEQALKDNKFPGCESEEQ